jgi:CheY-like chemotaxis protein
MKTRMRQNAATNQHEVTSLAFRLWEQAGRPTGRDLEFWFNACEMRPVRRGRRQASSTSRESGGNKTALVVDAKGPIREAIVHVLRRDGFQVLEASGGLEAQRLADSHRNIRLLLADFSTAGTSGLQLARWFQLRFPETKVLITTASLWEFLCQAGEHEEFGILVQPFSDAELRRMVQRLMAEV